MHRAALAFSQHPLTSHAHTNPDLIAMWCWCVTIRQDEKALTSEVSPLANVNRLEQGYDRDTSVLDARTAITIPLSLAIPAAVQ